MTFAQVIQRNENVPNRVVRDEAEPCARNGRTDYGEELALDDMDNNTFDDSGIDESFFGPWIMDSPMQHSTDSGSSRCFDLPISQAKLVDISDSQC